MPDQTPLDPFNPPDFRYRPGARASGAREFRSGSVSALAIISLVLGAISPVMICACYSSLITSLAAIITGHIALYRIRRSSGALTGGGLSIGGLVLGYLAFTVTAASLAFIFIAPAFMDSSDRDPTIARDPGETELLEVERKIISDDEGYALGNTPEARRLAQLFADEMKELDEMAFTQTDSTIKLTGGHYVTWCELRDGKCAFVVHVPEYRKFDSEAKEVLADFAWMTAQGAVEDALEPGDDLAVGLKGTLLYGAVMVGRVESPNEDSGAGLRFADADKSQLAVFFIRGVDAPQSGPANIVESTPAPGIAPLQEQTPPFDPTDPRIAPVPMPIPVPVPFEPPPVPDVRPPATARTPVKTRPESIEEAIEFLTEGNEQQQRQAVSYLGQQEPEAPNPAVAEALFKKLERDHSGGRFFVATALRPWVTNDHVEQLAPLIEDENVLVQTHVVETIGLLGTTEAAEVLASRLKDQSSATRVQFPLSKMGAVAEEPVLAVLEDPELDQARMPQVMYVLGQVGGRDSLAVLKPIADDASNPMRFAANSAIKSIERRLKE